MSEPKLKVSIDLLIQAYLRIPRVGGGRFRRKAADWRGGKLQSRCSTR